MGDKAVIRGVKVELFNIKTEERGVNNKNGVKGMKVPL